MFQSEHKEEKKCIINDKTEQINGGRKALEKVFKVNATKTKIGKDGKQNKSTM